MENQLVFKMTNEKKLYEKEVLKYDWHKLEFSLLAKEYLEQGEEGMPLAKQSLELLLKDIPCGNPGLVKTLTDERVIPLTIKNELEIYMGGYNAQTVEEMLAYHDAILKDYAGDNFSKVKEELKPFLTKKWSDILLDMEKAKHIIKGEKLKTNSKEEVESAKKTFEKYQKVYNTIKLIEQKQHSKLRQKVEDAYAKEVLESMYSPKEKNVEGEKEMKKAA